MLKFVGKLLPVCPPVFHPNFNIPATTNVPDGVVLIIGMHAEVMGIAGRLIIHPIDRRYRHAHAFFQVAANIYP